MTVLNMTKTHAFNLGRFVFGYKLLCALLRRMDGHKSEWHSFISAFCVGYLVFGKENGVNTQVDTFSA
jgi:peroxisomal membrane protein 4